MSDDDLLDAEMTKRRAEVARIRAAIDTLPAKVTPCRGNVAAVRAELLDFFAQFAVAVPAYQAAVQALIARRGGVA